MLLNLFLLIYRCLQFPTHGYQSWRCDHNCNIAKQAFENCQIHQTDPDFPTSKSLSQGVAKQWENVGLQLITWTDPGASQWLLFCTISYPLFHAWNTSSKTWHLILTPKKISLNMNFGANEGSYLFSGYNWNQIGGRRWTRMEHWCQSQFGYQIFWGSSARRSWISKPIMK